MQIFKFFYILFACVFFLNCQSGQKLKKTIIKNPVEIQLGDWESPKSVRMDSLGEYSLKDKSKKLLVVQMVFQNSTNNPQTISPMSTELWDLKKEKYLPLFIGYAQAGWGTISESFTRIYTAQKGYAAFKDIELLPGESEMRTFVFEVPSVFQPEAFQIYLLNLEKKEYLPLAKVEIH